MRDVAAAAGVSTGTVSNVLNRPDKVSPHTASRVMAAIQQLGFIRNDAARQLRAGRSRTIGLVIADVQNPFFTDIARAAENRAAEEGLSVVLGDANEDQDRESRYLELFAEQRVRGLLVSPVGDVMARLIQLRERGTPAVVVDKLIKDETFSSVSVDEVAGGRLAVGHLLEQGHRRIAYVTPPLEIRQIAERMSGALAAVREVPDASLEVIEVPALTVAAGGVGGDVIVGRTPARRPDAVFAANDLLALGVLQGLVSGGLQVPGDIALIGYDDIPFVHSATVPLSSIRQPTELIGGTAVEMLLAESAGDDPAFERRAVVYQPEIVVRASSMTV